MGLEVLSELWQIEGREVEMDVSSVGTRWSSIDYRIGATANLKRSSFRLKALHCCERPVTIAP